LILLLSLDIISHYIASQHLRYYLDAEHKNKKKKPFDFDGWVDYTLEVRLDGSDHVALKLTPFATQDTPQQENGFDCGVFTCQFLESLSRGEESFNFTQGNMPYLRRRMIWEIGHARLRSES
jgi:sentrin-specific protease 1